MTAKRRPRVSQGFSRRHVLLAAGTTAVALIASRHYGKASTLKENLAGDGVTNDLPSIERLLEDAQSAGRGTVKLPAGRFLLDPGPRQTALILPANVRLEGEGRDQTILVMAPGAQGHVINAPFGWVQIADLTIDGNAERRVGKNGHNLRVEGDKIVIERVRLINSLSYGLAVGQRRFARDVAVKDLEIINAGNDGIDLKNKMQRTEDVSFHNVLVDGFGRPDPDLDPALIGTREDRTRGKAAVDLRGQRCVVRGLRVIGIRRGRDGLRFRPGEAGQANGPGAHGGMASDVRIESNGEGKAIAVVARDVRLEDIQIRNVAVMLHLYADNTVVERGKLEMASQAAILATKTRHSRPARLTLRSLALVSPRELTLTDIDQAVFEDCQFSSCQIRVGDVLSRDRRVTLTSCRFDAACAASR